MNLLDRNLERLRFVDQIQRNPVVMQAGGCRRVSGWMAHDDVEREYAEILSEARLISHMQHEELDHGHVFSVISAKVICEAPDDATPADLQARVRGQLRRYGLDPDRPWLGRRPPEDDL